MPEDNLPAIPGDLAGVDAKIADYERQMEDTHAWFHNEPGQRDVAQLYEAQERLKAGDAPADTQAVVLADADVSGALDTIAGMGEIGSAWADEIRHNGAMSALQTGEEVRLDIIADLGDAADDVVAAFDGLDGNVTGAVYKELASAYVPRLPSADKNSLDQFGATGAGRILVSEWGADAARRLAVILHRWDRLTADLSDDEFDRLDHFFRVRLQPQERAAILRRLAA